MRSIRAQRGEPDVILVRIHTALLREMAEAAGLAQRRKVTMVVGEPADRARYYRNGDDIQTEGIYEPVFTYEEVF